MGEASQALPWGEYSDMFPHSQSGSGGLEGCLSSARSRSGVLGLHNQAPAALRGLPGASPRFGAERWSRSLWTPVPRHQGRAALWFSLVCAGLAAVQKCSY